jgi:hypothetical protein
VSRNFGEKWLTGAVFLDLAKVFDTEWVDSLLYKLRFLNFPSYLVNTISSYLHCWTFEGSFRTDTSTRVTGAGVAQGGKIFPFLFSLYVNDMPTASHHIKLALSDDTTVTATSRKPALLITCLESCLSDLERWLRE